MLFSKAVEFLKKERELILYGIFGVGSTVINIAVFHLCGRLGVALIPSNIIAWFFAFAFAFITNKAIVFQSRGWTNEPPSGSSPPFWRSASSPWCWTRCCCTSWWSGCWRTGCSPKSWSTSS